MSQFILFEDAGYADFLPMVYWRPVIALRCGRKTLLDNATYQLGAHISGVWTRPYVAAVTAAREQTPVNRPADEHTVLINARWLLTGPVKFKKGPLVVTCRGSIAYIACDAAMAGKVSPAAMLDPQIVASLTSAFPTEEIDADLVQYPWDLLSRNVAMLQSHWTSDNRAVDGKVSSAAYMIGYDYIHIGERSEVRPTAVIDASNGPVYISNDVLVDVHTYIEGPAYIGPGSVVRPHTSIRAGTSLSSLCKVGGELSGVIMTGYTNKQHEGFLGDAYVGSWVNLGAGTTNSNLKNTYGAVNVQLGARKIESGRQFLGCIIGDFVRLGIQQLLPAGAVVGVGAMCATGGFAPKYVPSFAWLTTAGQTTHDPQRLLQTTRMAMSRRKVEMTPDELELFQQLPALAESCGV